MFGFNIFLSGLAGGLKTGGVSSTNYNKGGIHTAISSGSNKEEIKNVIAQLVQQVFGLTVKETGSGNQKNKDITATHEPSTGDQKVHVKIQDSKAQTPNTVSGATGTVLEENNKVTITITVEGDPSNKTNDADKIAKKIWKAAEKAKDQANANITAFQDFNAFQYIAFHDILAMFCRFVYGKFAVGYNSTIVFM